MNSGSRGPDVPAPDQRETPDPDRRYDAMQILQSLTEVQKDIVELRGDTRRLINDINKLDGHVDTLRTTVAWVRGFLFAAIVLIPLFGVFVWWLIGENSIRDEILSQKPAIVHQETPPHK